MIANDAFDEIAALDGRPSLLKEYFRFAEHQVQERSLSAVLHTDFELLLSLNRANRAAWKPMLPLFDPAHSVLTGDNAVWLEVRDERQNSIAAHAVRFYDLGEDALDDALRSLRIFYSEPAPHRAAGEFFDVAGISAKRIRRRTVYGGAFWVHPDHRREGLASIIPRITRAYAYARWRPDFIWGIVEQGLHAGGVTRAYGPYRSTDTAISNIGPLRGLTLQFVWMTGDAMLDDIAGLLDYETVNSSRLMEIPSTKLPPSVVLHGSTKRS